MSSTLEASVFMGKNCSDNRHSIKNTGKEGEIFGVSQISWEDSSWRQLSLVNDEVSPSVSRVQRFMYFLIVCYVLER